MTLIVGKSNEYCKIVILRGGPMFVTLIHLSNPFPQIYILKNVYTNICLISFKLSQLIHYQNYDPTNQENFSYPRTLTPINKKVSTVCHNIENKAKKIKYYALHVQIQRQLRFPPYLNPPPKKTQLSLTINFLRKKSSGPPPPPLLQGF